MTSAAAIGYAILAAKKIGLSKEKISELSATMYKTMDLTEEEYAEKVYQKTP